SGRYRDARTSEALRESCGFERVRNVFAGPFATEARRGENFCWIRKLERIKGPADALHRGKIGLCKHFSHHALLLFADTVLAGDGAACGEAKFEDFHRKC